jgi:hypothetical protein
MATLTDSSSATTTADVYAGDIASHTPLVRWAVDRYLFQIEAEAEPGTFARIANLLNIANIAPDRVTLRLNESRHTLRVNIELTASFATAQSIQRKLKQLTDVIHADMRARHRTRPANAGPGTSPATNDCQPYYRSV